MSVPPNCRPARKVKLTLTVGQERAIRESIRFQLVAPPHRFRKWFDMTMADAFIEDHRIKAGRSKP